MRFNEFHKENISEYGMQSGTPTPVGAQSSGSITKKASPSPTTRGAKQQEPTIAKAKELEKDFEFPDEKGNVMKVVSPAGKRTLVPNDNENVVVAQNDKGETFVFDQDAEIVLPQADLQQEDVDDYLEKRKKNLGRQLFKKQNKLKQLIRAAKFGNPAEHQDPLFEINFNSADVIKSALDAPIKCGFEAETVWPNLGNGEEVDLEDADAEEIRDLVYDQEGRRSVETLDEAFREWLQEYAVMDIEGEIVDRMVREREEDEYVIDNYIEEFVDMDDVYGYKEDYLDDLRDKLSQGDLFDAGERDQLQDELDEREDWDNGAWAREYVEENLLDEFREWITDDIRDNGEAWDEAWEDAMGRYDWQDWMRREYGTWYNLLNDYNVYVVAEGEGGGVDAVAREIEDWASNDGSKTNDVRAGGYHSGRSVDNTYWRVEEDSSIEGEGAKAEIISPVYDTPREMLTEMKSLFDFFEENDVTTNNSTGMHITMSFAGEQAVLNPLKLALLVSDQYVLKEFGRQFNSYTRSQQENIEQQARRAMQEPESANATIEDLESILRRGIQYNKFTSINFKDVENDVGNKLIEFRIAGGNDYHKAYDKLAKAVVRYGATLEAAYDPDAYRQDYLKAIVKTIETAKGGVTKKEIDQLPGKQIPDTAFAKVVAALMHSDMRLDALENVARIEQAMSGGPAHDPYEAKKAFMWIMQNMLAGMAGGKVKPRQTSQIVRAIRDEQKRHGVSNEDIMRHMYDHYKQYRTSIQQTGNTVEDLTQKAAAALNAITMRPAEPPQFKAVIKYSPSRDQVVLMPKAKFNALMDDQDVELTEKDFKIVSLEDLGHVLRAKQGNMPEHYPEPEKWIKQFKAQYGIDPGVPGEAKPTEWIQPGPAAVRMAAKKGIEIIKEAATVFDKFDKLPLQEQLKLLAKVDKKKLDEAWSKKYKRSIDCDNPKGFSQKAHCAGKKKTKEGYWQDAVKKAEADREARKGKPYEKNPASHDKDGVYKGDKDLAGNPVPKKKKTSEAKKKMSAADRLAKRLKDKHGIDLDAREKYWKEKQKEIQSRIDKDKEETNEADQVKHKERKPKAKAGRTKHPYKGRLVGEGAVPERSFPQEYKKIMSKPLAGNDLRGQFEAYQLIPDPQMIKEFRSTIASAGTDVDLRSVFQSFAQHKLHPVQKKKVGIKESKLTEAKGIMGRMAGDKFVNGDQQLEFQGVIVYPVDYAQFSDAEQRDAAIEEIERKTGASIQWTNSPNKGTLAFGIATLTDPLNNDAPVYWGRYFRQKSVDMMGSWSNNQVPSGWKLQKAGAIKLDIGIDPQHLIKSEALHDSIDDVIQTVNRNSQGHQIQSELVGGLEQLKAKQHPIFEGQIQNLPALRDYFGEIMGPVALMAGVVGGQAEAANQDLLNGAGWDKCQVFWPQSMNYALVDSVFIGPDGQEVGISSKGGKGARASAKNIADAINKAPPELVKKHRKMVKIIKIVQDETAVDGPFRLAELLGILPPNLEKEIKKYIAAGKTDYARISKDAKELFNYGTPKQDAPGFNTGYALLALLAKKVAKIINQDPKFSAGCIEFLNQSSIVQLYCKMGKQGENARVTGWDSVYPPNFQGRVVLDGSKNYYSSRIGGKFAFGFV